VLNARYSNNHPFAWGRYTFMHNGTVGNFAELRVAILNEMSAAAQQQVYGTTDSEVLSLRAALARAAAHALRSTSRCSSSQTSPRV
jgi:predicted glutamine amidotransferase